MQIVGLVGGIASGKSAVAAELARLGAVVLDADTAAHTAINLPQVKASLVERWGQQIIDPSGNIDRQAVAEIVFAADDPEQTELRYLESLLHPVLREDFQRQIDEHRQAGTGVVVIDAPLLLEAGWGDLCDSILFVDAPEADRYERAERRNWSEQEFARRELAQMPISEKRSHATHVIANDGTLQDLERAVGEFWRQNTGETSTD